MSWVRWWALAVLFAATTQCYGEDRIVPVVGTSNNRVEVLNTYPEYWVDGRPFMTHASAFFYHRLPRDRWAQELIHLKDLGINTIDVYPFWNWHQPEENILDFDGHTNPRRDLHYLLQLIKNLDMKATLRPGPYYTSEWRNGGYPDWLLRRAEYHMSEQSILEGRYPRLSALQYDKSEQAAAGYLENQTHLDYSRKWYRDVLGVAGPYLAGRGGPILSIQIDDDQAIGRENYNGPQFWKYMDLLRDYVEEITSHSKLPYYINGADMRLNAESNYVTGEPFWNTGQDYQMSGEGGYSGIFEAAKNKFLTELVKTQPLFPPGIIEFQAGWFVDEKDTYARSTDPSNTLMASRVMFQNGLKLLNYYPLNDTLYPAGFECQWANWFYGWETAINYAGQETGRAPYVRRNGRLLDGMGPLLGAAHLLPDAALVYPMATFPQAELTADEANFVANWSGRVLWSGIFDHFNFELIDSDNTPEENFQRYRVLLLPNVISGEAEAGKKFPHLQQYSGRSQRLVQQYVQAGGELVVFPSLPRGEVFDEMFAPFGPPQTTGGDSQVTFSDGTVTSLIGGHTTVSPGDTAGVKLFARDAQNGTVGASLPYGKGTIVFFGGDFARWSAPPGTVLSFDQGGVQGTSQDYPEELQRSARAALSALMREADAKAKIRSDETTEHAREPGLYTTELIADAGSESFERRSPSGSSFAFAGVTNFSADHSYTANLLATDPQLTDPASTMDRYVRLPHVTVPPRESVLLPVRLPLSHPFLQLGPGFSKHDEIYYATAELTGANYDGTTLHMEFTAPSDAEVALRLGQNPTAASVDGRVARIRRDAARRLFVVHIPKGMAPDFIRKVDVSYQRATPKLLVSAPGPWIAGESHEVTVRVVAPRSSPVVGTLNFRAGVTGPPGAFPPLEASTANQTSFAFPVEVPADAPEGMSLELVATLHTRNPDNTYMTCSQVTVHRRFSATVEALPGLQFPLREDQSFPMIHPVLAAIDLPGTAKFHIKIRNWLDEVQTVSLTVTTEAELALSVTAQKIQLAAGAEQTVEMAATPGKTGAYRFAIHLRSSKEKFDEEAVVAAVAKGDALAYTFDFDRDGYDDVVLENQQVRMFVSPFAGGRSFAYVSKRTNQNAFDSIGGMRDTFTTRFEPDDLKGLPDWTRANWMGLYNRPYSFRIATVSGRQVEVVLEHTASDIYPGGIKIQRTLSLAGDQNAVIATSILRPAAMDKPQAFVSETSVPFRSFSQVNYSHWFLPGQPAQEFMPGSKSELTHDAGFFATRNQATGETFALMLLSAPDKIDLATENHSALLRVTYPSFSEAGQSYSYRMAYYLGEGGQEEVRSVFNKLKALVEKHDRPAAPGKVESIPGP